MAQVYATSEQSGQSSPNPVQRFFLSSDARAAAGISRSHFDFYLREGLVVPVGRTESGYLVFDEAEIDRLRQIVTLRRDGQSLKQIREEIGR